MNDWFRDAFGEHYIRLYAHRDEREALAMVDLINRAAPVAPGARVLDAPCGTGRHARIFARQGFHVFGIDLSADLLAHAKMEPGNVSYIRSDIRHLPFQAASFDLVVNLFSSFGYFMSDADNYRVLEDLARVCRPSGRFVFDYFNAGELRRTLVPASERRTADGWLVRELREISGMPPRVNKRVHIHSGSGSTREYVESVRLFEPDEIESMMSRAGFQIDARLGDYSGAPFAADSPRLFIAATRQ